MAQSLFFFGMKWRWNLTTSGDAIIRDQDVKHEVHDILIHTSFYKQICVITISEFAIV